MGFGLSFAQGGGSGIGGRSWYDRSVNDDPTILRGHTDEATQTNDSNAWLGLQCWKFWGTLTKLQDEP